MKKLIMSTLFFTLAINVCAYKYTVENWNPSPQRFHAESSIVGTTCNCEILIPGFNKKTNQPGTGFCAGCKLSCLSYVQITDTLGKFSRLHAPACFDHSFTIDSDGNLYKKEKLLKIFNNTKDALVVRQYFVRKPKTNAQQSSLKIIQPGQKIAIQKLTTPTIIPINLYYAKANDINIARMQNNYPYPKLLDEYIRAGFKTIMVYQTADFSWPQTDVSDITINEDGVKING